MMVNLRREVGEPANVVLYNPNSPVVVDPEAQATLSNNSPFAGMELPGRVVATFLRGRATVLNSTPITQN
jgi:dihydroorotase